MVKIIADTVEELSLAESIFYTGLANNHSPFGEFDDNITVIYSLSNGHKILTNKHNDIVGEIIVGKDGNEYTRFINKD